MPVCVGVGCIRIILNFVCLYGFQSVQTGNTSKYIISSSSCCSKRLRDTSFEELCCRAKGRRCPPRGFGFGFGAVMSTRTHDAWLCGQLCTAFNRQSVGRFWRKSCVCVSSRLKMSSKNAENQKFRMGIQSKGPTWIRTKASRIRI